MSGAWKYMCLAVAILFLLTGCGQLAPTTVHPAFYHWKTTFDPDIGAVQLVRHLETERIYLRVFDIDWDEGLKAPAPIAYLKAQQNLGIFKQ